MGDEKLGFLLGSVRDAVGHVRLGLARLVMPQTVVGLLSTRQRGKIFEVAGSLLTVVAKSLEASIPHDRS